MSYFLTDYQFVLDLINFYLSLGHELKLLVQGRLDKMNKSLLHYTALAAYLKRLKIRLSLLFAEKTTQNALGVMKVIDLYWVDMHDPLSDFLKPDDPNNRLTTMTVSKFVLLYGTSPSSSRVVDKTVLSSITELLDGNKDADAK